MLVAGKTTPIRQLTGLRLEGKPVQSLQAPTSWLSIYRPTTTPTTAADSPDYEATLDRFIYGIVPLCLKARLGQTDDASVISPSHSQHDIGFSYSQRSADMTRKCFQRRKK